MNTSDEYANKLNEIITQQNCKEVINKDCVKVICGRFINDFGEIIDNDVPVDGMQIINSFIKKWEYAIETTTKSIKNKEDYFKPMFVKHCVKLYMYKIINNSHSREAFERRTTKFTETTGLDFQDLFKYTKYGEGVTIFAKELEQIPIRHWQELFYKKYKYDRCYIYANDGTQMALQITDNFNAYIDSNDTERILSEICSCLNDEGETPFTKNLKLDINFSEIMISMKDKSDNIIPILEVRGWGHILSSVDYDEDIAVNIQDAYAKYIFNKLNK